MASKNDITGDAIRTKGLFSKQAEDNFDAIFRTSVKPKEQEMINLRFAEKTFPISDNMNQILRILQVRDSDGIWRDVPTVSVQDIANEKEVKSV